MNPAKIYQRSVEFRILCGVSDDATVPTTREEVGALAKAADFEGCTLALRAGLWEGRWEKSIEITIIDDVSKCNDVGDRVELFAEALRKFYKQDEVWVIHQHVDVCRLKKGESSVTTTPSTPLRRESLN